MKITCTYYGQIAELSNKEKESFEIEPNTSLGHFKSVLINHISELHKVEYSIAINNSFVTDDVLLEDKAELHIMPPFAGG